MHRIARTRFSNPSLVAGSLGPASFWALSASLRACWRLRFKLLLVRQSDRTRERLRAPSRLGGHHREDPWQPRHGHEPQAPGARNPNTKPHKSPMNKGKNSHLPTLKVLHPVTPATNDAGAEERRGEPPEAAGGVPP